MSRCKRSVEEVEEARERIRQAALALFDTGDYREVSMRKVAAGAGCSAATIYRYYRDKDAMYLDVLQHGFQILLDMFLQEGQAPSPVGRLQRLTQVFYRFSVEYPSYYDIMFNLPVPKYLDYVGTDMEPTARDEKSVAIAALDLATAIVREGQVDGDFKPDVDPRGAAISLLAACHGVISLHRSRVLPEIEDDLQQAYSRTAQTIIESLALTTRRPQAKSPDARGQGPREGKGRQE